MTLNFVPNYNKNVENNKLRYQHIQFSHTLRFEIYQSTKQNRKKNYTVKLSQEIIKFCNFIDLEHYTLPL